MNTGEPLNSNSTREELLQNGLGNASIALDASGLAGLTAGDEFTVSSLLNTFREKRIELSAATLRKGLNQLRKHGLIDWRKDHNGKRGRPSIIYTLRPLRWIAEKLGVIIGVIDELTIAAVKRIRDYRSHLHHALLKRVSGEMTRTWLGKRLGVGPRSTYNYEQDFDDINITPTFIETEITWDNLDTLPRQRESGPVFLKIHIHVPYTEEEINEQYAHINPIWRPTVRQTYTVERKFPAVRSIAVKLLKQGHKVWHVRQGPNHYRAKSEYDEFVTTNYEDFTPIPIQSPYLLPRGGARGGVEEEPRMDTPNLNQIVSQNDRGAWTAQEAWNATLHQMELQLDKNAWLFDVKPTRLIDYDDGKFIVECPNTRSQQMCQHRWVPVILSILSVLCPDAEIEFTLPPNDQIAP